MLTIASPNTDRSLLTLAELRAAAGVSDGSKDAVLVPLGNYISAAITKACKVPHAGAIPPTLRLETVTETFSYTGNLRNRTSLVLSRRPVVDVVSLASANTALVENTDFICDGASGVISRLIGGYRYPWVWDSIYGNTVVEYSAGFAIVPDDLKYAAIKFVRAEVQTGSRDPNLKSLRIDGVSERTWWVSDRTSANSAAMDSIIPGEVMDILIRGGYVNMVVA